jgi:hypothetical protein
VLKVGPKLGSDDISYSSKPTLQNNRGVELLSDSDIMSVEFRDWQWTDGFLESS